MAAAIDFVVIGLFSALCAVMATVAMLLQVDPLQRDPTAGEWAVGYAIALLWFYCRRCTQAWARAPSEHGCSDCGN